jgi:DNA polymerase III subunit delta'
MSIYSWQRSSWDALFLNNSKMPHAFIFYGSSTIEINIFVKELIKSTLCSNQSTDNFSCKKCQNCLWGETNHPDLKVIDNVIDKDQSSNIINVSNVREAKKFLELTAHQLNGKKIVVLYNAERLTVAASNALLKTIEEPPKDCLIILTINDLANLLPTITSRCRLVSFPKPSKDEAKEVLNQNNNSDLIENLNLYNNSPLELINDKEMLSNINTILIELKKGKKIDLIKMNNIWLDNGLVWIINLLQKWSYELLLFKLSGNYNYFPNHLEVVDDLALNADLSKLLTFQKTLNNIKSYANSTVNKEINLNSVMIEYKKIFKS